MPELPEVETIVKDLNKKILDRKIQDIWFNWPKMFKGPKGNNFKKEVVGSKIKKVKRFGKNILFFLDSRKIILIHQKMTGHLLVGKWRMENKKWMPIGKGPLNEKVNDYIHLMFFLNGGQMMALSDLRKFAKVMVFGEDEMGEIEDIKEIGPDPLDKDFKLNDFLKLCDGKKGKIKTVLLDQSFVAGIGNIYSDEILWSAKINPLEDIFNLTKKEKEKIFKSIQKILKEAVVARGTSISDYRDTAGKRGKYDLIRKVYRREGEKCPRCKFVIKRIKIGGRSAHYCPVCQSH